MHADSDTTTIFSNELSTIGEDTKGNIWIVHRSGVFEKLDIRTKKITFRSHALKRMVTEESPVKDGDMIEDTKSAIVLEDLIAALAVLATDHGRVGHAL